MSKKIPSPAPLPISPAWIEKTSPKGKRYRVCTVPLNRLGQFLESEGFEPKAFFFYPPEKGEVLGVRRIGDQEEKAL